MGKHLRIWIDGDLEVDTAVAEAELPLGPLGSRWQEIVVLAAEQGQPWRVELGDSDADVNDQHWPQAAAGAKSRTTVGR
jgi:hypothetical protein